MAVYTVEQVREIAISSLENWYLVDSDGHGRWEVCHVNDRFGNGQNLVDEIPQKFSTKEKAYNFLRQHVINKFRGPAFAETFTECARHLQSQGHTIEK
ncbi:hypothetical protein [Yersinia pseudotuberculosis]|uniref:hypothetical protein n=1 Tax=Yersinia pseudotuberculosis TaxID=633 RepID=UPI001A9F606A|nr:hypothetical protein [Yersinia pseudotuberculosis]MBO1560472.1 hypothetical protein [Yersinia pseudotuberculosis]MCF1163248.1 hypothetical protein [Yersinia pseudotuberculosis]